MVVHMLFRHKWESNELALLRRDLGRWTVDSVDIFYKLLGIATVVYCKGKGYLCGKVFFYTQKRIASREKKTSSERNYTFVQNLYLTLLTLTKVCIES